MVSFGGIWKETFCIDILVLICTYHLQANTCIYIFFGWYLFASKTFDSFKEIVYKCVADGKIDKEFNDWRREKRIRDFIKPFKRILMVTSRRYHSRHISNRANNLSIITLLYCYLFPKWIIKMLVDVLPKTQ